MLNSTSEFNITREAWTTTRAHDPLWSLSFTRDVKSFIWHLWPLMNPHLTRCKHRKTLIGDVRRNMRTRFSFSMHASVVQQQIAAKELMKKQMQKNPKQNSTDKNGKNHAWKD